MSGTEVGVVRALTVYPVKSMRGVAMDVAYCDWYGLNGDRKWAFVRGDDRSGFPWLTGRHASGLLQYQPYFVDPADLLTAPVHVQSPSGLDRPVTDSGLNYELSRQYGGPVSVLRLKRGTYDCMPVSLISTNTIGAVGATTDARRFRANILVEPIDSGATPEQAWPGHVLRFGQQPDGAVIRVDYPTERCQMINLDPESGARDPAVLRAVGRRFDAKAGVYATVQARGHIRVGAVIYRQAMS